MPAPDYQNFVDGLAAAMLLPVVLILALAYFEKLNITMPAFASGAEPSKRGQNEPAAANHEIKAPDDDVAAIEGINPQQISALRRAGFHRVSDVRGLAYNDLVAIKGMGPKGADLIQKNT